DTLCENNPLRGDPYAEAQIEINPNPARYELQFKLPLCPCGQWEIFDVAGRLIHAFPANSQDGPFYKVYVGHWPAGVYVIRGKTTTHQAFVKRFVVMR
ncbi:MAG: T9SS type A sorting domain-containing protein, partial [Saprospiraceae bacterium]|nr:T9SS type A sorting domain-containing protein [Saprospiraceae bacterium]